METSETKNIYLCVHDKRKMLGVLRMKKKRKQGFIEVIEARSFTEAKDRLKKNKECDSYTMSIIQYLLHTSPHCVSFQTVSRFYDSVS